MPFNKQLFSQSTISGFQKGNSAPFRTDLANAQGRFMAYLGQGASVLDIACKKGRTLKHFSDHGLNPTGLASSHEDATNARLFSGCKIYTADLLTFTPSRFYDGVWAQNALMQTPAHTTPEALEKVWQWLKNGGIFYASFKNTTSTPLNVKGFSDGGFSLAEVKQLFGLLKGAEVLETWSSATPEGTATWQNIILRKN